MDINPAVSAGFPHSSAGEESACDAGDSSLIPMSGRSAGERISYPLQYSQASFVTQLVKNPSAMGRSPGEVNPLQQSVPENFVDCIVHGVAKSQTRLGDFHFDLHIHQYPLMSDAGV